MLNISKIETMVVSVGSVSLDAVRTWFPKASINEIKEAINKSDKIEVSGSKVIRKTAPNNVGTTASKSKTNTNTKEKGTAKTKQENSIKDIAVTQTRPIENTLETKNIYESLKYEEICNMIQRYNEQILSKHRELIENDDTYKYNAILSFLKEKYDLTTVASDNFNRLYLLHKKSTETEVGYAILVPDFNEEVLKLIQKTLDSETVFVYYLNSLSVDIDNIISTIFPKATTKIIEKYKMYFEIDTLSLEVLQIKTRVGK